MKLRLMQTRPRLELSRPARGAWIEIAELAQAFLFDKDVAPRMGRVD